MGSNKIDLAKDTIYTHPSTIQCNASNEISSLKTSVSNGKSLIASAITGKGVSTASDATFQTMANNINGLKVPANSYFTDGLLNIYETPYINLNGQENINEDPGRITDGGYKNYYCKLEVEYNTELHVQLYVAFDSDNYFTICKITRTYNALTNILTVGVKDINSQYVNNYNIYSNGDTYSVRINFSHTGHYGDLTFENRDYLTLISDTTVHTYVKNLAGNDANVYIPVSSVKVVSA